MELKSKFLKQDKGVAGLTVFLSLITMLFVIGLLVMVFSLMGGALKDSAEENSTAEDVINDTTGSISGATEWFPLFIIIGAMVVLILLTVIIITAIRSSGLIASGGTGTA